MPGDMNTALSLAQQICWDEGYGYRLGGHAASYSDGVDCGGLVFHCLHNAGYNVADTSPGVSNMPSILTNIGFVGTQYSGNVKDLKHGDIITMVHWSGSQVTAGHTCFICENINAYVNGDWGWQRCNSIVGNCALAKVEASGTRGHTSQGDHDNGLGAYTEVWCHTFSNVYDTSKYDPSDVYVWRDPNFNPNTDIISAIIAAIGGVIALPVVTGIVMVDRKKRRKK